MNTPRNHPCIVLILLNAPQKSYLFLLALLPWNAVTCGFFSHNIVPIIAEHSMCLSTSRLSVCEHWYVEPFGYFSQERFNKSKDLSLGGGRSQCQLYFLLSLVTCDFDLENVLDECVSTCPLRAITCGSSSPLRAGLTLTIVTIRALLGSPLSVYYMIIFIMLRLTRCLLRPFKSTNIQASLFSTAKISKHWGIADDY